MGQEKRRLPGRIASPRFDVIFDRVHWSVIITLAAVPVLGLLIAIMPGSPRPAGLLSISSMSTLPAPQSSEPIPAVLPSDTPAQPEVDVKILEERPLTEAEARSAETTTFNGRPVRPVKVLRMEVTAYSPDARSCAPFDDGFTASGYSVWTNGMKLIAADKKFKFGTLMSVPGYNGNRPTPVLDRGGAIKGNRLDLLFPTHESARGWGRQTVLVTIWEYADGRS